MYASEYACEYALLAANTPCVLDVVAGGGRHCHSSVNLVLAAANMKRVGLYVGKSSMAVYSNEETKQINMWD